MVNNWPDMKIWIKRLALLLLVATLTAACARQEAAPKPVKPGTPAAKGEQGPPRAAFTVVNFRAVDPQDRPEAEGKAREQVSKVLELVNGLYNEAFLDPSRWAGGTHPGIGAYFTQQAQTGLAANIGTLALGDLSASITDVQPQRQEITRLTLYVDNELGVPVGLATVAFDAVAINRAKGAPPVTIRQNADLWLEKQGDSFKISAYRADINAQSQPGAGQ